MLTLDGSTLEGGGQLVRVALSLSSICGIPVRITNIRANRAPRSRGGEQGHGHSTRGDARGRGRKFDEKRAAKPVGGLKESHLAAVNWLAAQCRATVEGAALGEKELVFMPGKAKEAQPAEGSNRDEEVIALHNPGSVWLVWQAIFPFSIFRSGGSNDGHRPTGQVQHPGSDLADAMPETPSGPTPFRITLEGGTNVPKAPSSEYVQQVLSPLCEMIGLPKLDINVVRRGWAGSAPEIGLVELTVHQPKKTGSATQDQQWFSLEPFTVQERGSITQIDVTIVAGSQETYSMLEVQLLSSLRALGITSGLAPDVPIAIHPSSTDSSGDERRIYVLLVAHTSNGWRLGRDCLGSGRKITNESERRKIVVELVGTVTRELLAECQKGGCVDEYAEDQLVIFQALADGRTAVDAGHGLAKAEDGRLAVQGSGRGSLHTRTVRWVCEQMLGMGFEGVGNCSGILVNSRETDTDAIAMTMAMEKMETGMETFQ